jgi:hypothetical protein
VKDGTCFGLVECDIHVPESKKVFFAEMTPIFKNIEVGREDIGEFMKKFTVENKLLTSPRRTLIGSYIGEEILLATPLLQWYLKKGLVVTNIYQVIEYTPVACFEKFGLKVSEARRNGDRDPEQSITSETMKLLGNAAYEKTLTNKETHREIKYCSQAETGSYVNSGLFRKMTELAPDLFEVEMQKDRLGFTFTDRVFCLLVRQIANVGVLL